ncbi:MAG: hypothetical protein REI12_07255 [Pedobacter sp.]|nr:hypothetical protein [Pedobacter sp.]
MYGFFSDWYGRLVIFMLIVVGIQHCSSIRSEEKMRAENARLIEANIRLQERSAAAAGLKGMEQRYAEAAERASEPAMKPEDNSPLQLLEKDGLSIRVMEEHDQEEGYCTTIRYEADDLFKECSPTFSRFTLLNAGAYGLPVFREDWVRPNLSNNEPTLGVTIWGVEDKEMVQLISLPTSLQLFSCKPGEACAAGSERWLKATFQLQESGAAPELRYRYLSETGDYGESRYVWQKNRFFPTGENPAAVVLKKYGF